MEGDVALVALNSNTNQTIVSTAGVYKVVSIGAAISLFDTNESLIEVSGTVTADQARKRGRISCVNYRSST